MPPPPTRHRVSACGARWTSCGLGDDYSGTPGAPSAERPPALTAARLCVPARGWHEGCTPLRTGTATVTPTAMCQAIRDSICLRVYRGTRVDWALGRERGRWTGDRHSHLSEGQIVSPLRRARARARREHFACKYALEVSARSLRLFEKTKSVFKTTVHARAPNAPQDARQEEEPVPGAPRLSVACGQCRPARGPRRSAGRSPSPLSTAPASLCARPLGASTL